MLLKAVTTCTAALAVAALAAAPALAAVSYSPDSGGFVGKGDVQTAFGLNNAAVVAAAQDFVFEYELSETFTQVCTKVIEAPETGNGKGREDKVVSHTFKRSVGVPATVLTSTARKSGSREVTGFQLGAASSAAGVIPTDLCPNDNSGFEAVDVEGNATSPTSSGTEGLGLTVTLHGVTHALPNTVV